MDYKYLKNPRNLRAFFKEASSSEIFSIIEKIKEFYEEVKANEILKEKEEKERADFLNGLLDSLDKHNFTIDDLAKLKGASASISKRRMKPRYEYEGIDGQMYQWSGQGKIPKTMNEVMKRDGITDKNHYLIDPDDKKD